MELGALLKFAIPSRPASNLLHDYFGSGIFRRQVAAHVVTFFLIGQSRSTPCRLRLAPPSLKWLLNHSCAVATHPLQWPSLCGFWQAASLNGCCCPAPSRPGRSRLRCSCNLQERREGAPGGKAAWQARMLAQGRRGGERVIVDHQAPLRHAIAINPHPVPWASKFADVDALLQRPIHALLFHPSTPAQAIAPPVLGYCNYSQATNPDSQMKETQTFDNPCNLGMKHAVSFM